MNPQLNEDPELRAIEEKEDSVPEITSPEISRETNQLIRVMIGVLGVALVVLVWLGYVISTKLGTTPSQVKSKVEEIGERLEKVSSELQHYERQLQITQSRLLAPQQATRLLKTTVSRYIRPCVFVDSQGRILAWSDGAEKLLNWERVEMVGKSLESIIPMKDRKAHGDAFFRAMNNPDADVRVHVVDCSVLARDGTEIPSSIQTVTVPEFGTVATITPKQGP